MTNFILYSVVKNVSIFQETVLHCLEGPPMHLDNTNTIIVEAKAFSLAKPRDFNYIHSGEEIHIPLESVEIVITFALELFRILLFG